MKEAEKRLKTAGAFARETLDRAEETGLTIAEVFLAADLMKNIVKNELAEQGTPYKRKQPRT